MSKKKVYFARSIDMYDTPIDQWQIKQLKELGFEVVDPNKFFSKEEYEKQGMTLFFEKIEDCDLFVFKPNADGNFTAGVAKEYQCARNKGLLCLQLPYKIHGKTLTVEQTRKYLKFVGAR